MFIFFFIDQKIKKIIDITRSKEGVDKVFCSWRRADFGHFNEGRERYPLLALFPFRYLIIANAELFVTIILSGISPDPSNKILGQGLVVGVNNFFLRVGFKFCPYFSLKNPQTLEKLLLRIPWYRQLQRFCPGPLRGMARKSLFLDPQ